MEKQEEKEGAEREERESHRKRQLRDLKGNLQRSKCGAGSRQRFSQAWETEEIKFSHLYRWDEGWFSKLRAPTSDV